jgi:predicted acetyltransferase
MSEQLDDVAGRGEALAVLTASEATIYGRFGYGVATQATSVRIDLDHSSFGAEPAGEWEHRLVDDEEAIRIAPALFDAHVASRPGGLTRPDAFWPAVFSPTETWVGGGEHFTVVCGRPGAPPSGYAIYRVARDMPPGHWRTHVTEVVATDDDAEAALWRFLLDLDLTSSLEIRTTPRDGALRWRLTDARAYRVTGERDFLWLRVVDPIAALRDRGYGSTGELALELHDAFRPATSGCYRLSVGADQEGRIAASAVARTDAAPDLSMDGPALSAIFLGGVRPSTLATAGRVAASSTAALALADRMFAAEREPFCLTQF